MSDYGGPQFKTNGTPQRNVEPLVNADNDILFVEANITNESLDVNIQDQHTPVIIAPLNRITDITTITAETVINGYTINVASVTGIVAQTPTVVGTLLIVFSSVTARIFICRVLAINVLELTVDRPIDSVFPVDSNVDVTTTEMNVDGSTTPVTFGLRGANQPTAVPVSFDITRLMFGVLTDTIGGLADFGDLPSLNRGVQVRKRDGTIQNIFNWKNNGELAAVAFDFNTYLATNPVQGQNGFTARLTFGGQNKIGVVVRLAPGEDLEVIIQDDLTDLVRFGIIAEGHVVED